MLSARGQVSLLVIIGLVMVIFVGAYYIAYNSSVQAPKFLDQDLDDIDQFVQGCVDQLLRDAVQRHGQGFYDDYESAIESYIFTYLENCANVTEYLRIYPGISVTKYDVTQVNAILKEDKSSVSVKVDFPFVIKKGTNEHKLTYYYSDYSFIKRACIMINVDNRCRALESLSGNLLGIEYNYQQGDLVIIAGKCRAC